MNVIFSKAIVVLPYSNFSFNLSMDTALSGVLESSPSGSPSSAEELKSEQAIQQMVCSGPLSSFWKAAHWHQKMKRSDFDALSVEEGVQLISAQEGIPLIMASHLLLGLCRVHNRQVMDFDNDIRETCSRMNTLSDFKLEDKKKEQRMEPQSGSHIATTDLIVTMSQKGPRFMAKSADITLPDEIKFDMINEHMDIFDSLDVALKQHRFRDAQELDLVFDDLEVPSDFDHGINLDACDEEFSLPSHIPSEHPEPHDDPAIFDMHTRLSAPIVAIPDDTKEKLQEGIAPFSKKIKFGTTLMSKPPRDLPRLEHDSKIDLGEGDYHLFSTRRNRFCVLMPFFVEDSSIMSPYRLPSLEYIVKRRREIAEAEVPRPVKRPRISSEDCELHEGQVEETFPEGEMEETFPEVSADKKVHSPAISRESKSRLGKTEDELIEIGYSTRTKTMHNEIDAAMENDSTSLNLMLAEGRLKKLGGDRINGEIATGFFELLVLKTLNVIDIQQDQPYADITISSGPEWQSL